MIYTGNKSATFHGNILSLNENTAKSFRGATFLTQTVHLHVREAKLTSYIYDG